MNKVIIVDTREQLPLWSTDAPGILRLKLDEGDYTTTALMNKMHVERKSGIDLYGSIMQGHERFKREIIRAQDKGLRLVIFVECTKEEFIGKKFKGGFRLQCYPHVLRKIIRTMEDRYSLKFIWCVDREDMKESILAWFEVQEQRFKNVEKQDTGKPDKDSNIASIN